MIHVIHLLDVFTLLSIDETGCYYEDVD
jgi:hypothetical protein